MKDEWGRDNNRAQVIRSLDKVRMAHLITHIQNNPEKYPNTTEGWITWLNEKSGDNLFNL